MTTAVGKVRGVTAPYTPGQQVYLIVWGAYVKIGTSTDPVGRLARVTERGSRPPRQNGDPELVGTIAGGYGAESWLHAALAGHRAAGEWFHLRGPVADLVAAALSRGVDDLAPRPSRAHRAQGIRAQIRPGLVPFTAVAGRTPDELAVQHAVLLAPELLAGSAATGTGHSEVTVMPGTLALCGTTVRRVLGPFRPGHVRTCGRCAKELR